MNDTNMLYKFYRFLSLNIVLHILAFVYYDFYEIKLFFIICISSIWKNNKKRNFSAFSRGWLIELLIQLCCALLLQKYILEMLNNAFDNSTLYLSFFVTIFISFDNDLALCFGDFLCRLNQDILENICP